MRRIELTPKGNFKRVYRHSSAENGEIRLNVGKLRHRALATNKHKTCLNVDENLFKRVYWHSSAENGEIRLNGGKLHHHILATNKQKQNVPKS